MKILAVALGVLIILIQAPLWLGKGSWLRVWQVENELSNQKIKNSQLEARNAALSAECATSAGPRSSGERARYESA